MTNFVSEDNTFVSYNYSSVNELMSKYEDSFNFDFELGVPAVGSVSAKINAESGVDRSEYSYHETLMVDGRVRTENHVIEDFDSKDVLMKHCFSENFLRTVERKTADNSINNMSDADLAKHIFDKYGTHVVLGVDLGGTYIAKYTISTNSESIAKQAKASLNVSGDVSYLEIIEGSLDIGLTANGETSWSGEEKVANFKVTWSGTPAGGTISPSGLESAVDTWAQAIANNDKHAVWLAFTQNGAIPIYNLLLNIDSAVAAEYKALFEREAGEAYVELYDQFTSSSTLPMQVYNENGDNVLEIDLSSYQRTGSMEGAYDPNFLEGVLTVYPTMYGRYIDKILVKGAFDEAYDGTKNLIDKFSISLSEKWNRDVDVVVQNLGVVCASENGIVDASKINGSVMDVNIEYQGINLIKETDGDYEFHGSINSEKYDYKFDVAEGETLVYDSTRIHDGIILPVATKASYQFGGWIDGDGNFVTEADGTAKDEYTAAVDITTLYAHWEPLTYKITLDGNSATTAAGITAIYQKYGVGYYDGNNADLTDKQISLPAKTGYVFGGYYLTADNSSAVDPDSDTMIVDSDGIIRALSTIFTADATVYAYWIPDVFAITLNNDGATTAGTTVYYQMYKTGLYANEACTTSISKITTPKKKGYGFGGYYISVSNNSTMSAAGTTQCIKGDGTIIAGNDAFTSDAKLVALWTPGVYTVTLNSGTTSGTNQLYVRYTVGVYSNNGCTTAFAGNKITIPSKTGYDFGGYYASVSNNNTVNAAGTTQYIKADGTILDVTKNISGDTTLVALWKPITYTVTYNGNGATSGSTTNSTHTYDVAKNLTANGYVKEHTVTYNYNYSGATNTTATAKCSFAGWSTTSTGSVAYSNKQSVTNLTTDSTYTLYAQWNAGSVTLPTPTRTGYTFGGWYKEASCTNRVGNGGATYSTKQNVTLYAKWTANTYTVTYNANGGSGSTATSTHTYGVAKALTSNGYSRSGYTFLGWSTSSSATTPTYSNAASVKNLITSGSLTLYAVWVKTSGTASFSDDTETNLDNVTPYVLTYDVALNKNQLKENGYSKLNIVVEYEAWEGYWFHCSKPIISIYSGTSVYTKKTGELLSYGKWHTFTLSFEVPVECLTDGGAIKVGYDGIQSNDDGTEKPEGGEKYYYLRNSAVKATAIK